MATARSGSASSTNSTLAVVSSCHHTPFSAPNRVRNAPWCATRASTATRTTAGATSGSASVTCWWKGADGVKVPKKNRWIGVSGARPSTRTDRMTTGSPVATSSSEEIVGRWNRSRALSRSPTSRAFATTRMATIESPPRVKKLSSTPTRGTPIASAQIPASTRCTSVRGSTCRSAAASGSGSAAWSTFSREVSGNSGSTTTAAGTMYSGSTPRRWSSSAETSGSAPTGTTYPMRRTRPRASSRAATTAAATSGCSASTTSTSPGSTR